MNNPLTKFIPEPSAEAVAKVREVAEQEALERGVPIDRICVVATASGRVAKVIELDE